MVKAPRFHERHIEGIAQQVRGLATRMDERFTGFEERLEALFSSHALYRSEGDSIVAKSCDKLHVQVDRIAKQGDTYSEKLDNVEQRVLAFSDGLRPRVDGVVKHIDVVSDRLRKIEQHFSLLDDLRVQGKGIAGQTRAFLDTVGMIEQRLSCFMDDVRTHLNSQVDVANIAAQAAATSGASCDFGERGQDLDEDGARDFHAMGSQLSLHELGKARAQCVEALFALPPMPPPPSFSPKR